MQSSPARAITIVRTAALAFLLAFIFSLGLAAPTPADARQPSWEPPLGEPLRVSAGFDLPHGPYQAGHRGIDLPAGSGDTVVAPAAGEITFVGSVVDRPVVSIRVDARTVVSLEPVSSDLVAGEFLSRGEALGEVAEGGHCDGACLHLGVRVDDAYVHPLRYFKPRPQLLPW